MLVQPLAADSTTAGMAAHRMHHRSHRLLNWRLHARIQRIMMIMIT
jgi:hypothetical protein